MSNGLAFEIFNIIEIDEKHALQNYQNECGPGYSFLTYFFLIPTNF